MLTRSGAARLDNSGPKRRLRDRLLDRDGRSNPSLGNRYELQNLLLLVDDDLSETALSISGIETFLADALALLDSPKVRASELASLARDEDILSRLDTLTDTLQSLRRRLSTIASTIAD